MTFWILSQFVEYFRRQKLKSHSIPRQARACSELVESDGEQTCLGRPVVSKVEPSRKSRIILVSLIIALLAATTTNARYSGGTGDPNDPYQIATAEDLNDIGNHLEDFNKHFILINDVNLAEYTGTHFKTIGNNTIIFTGVFDGNDHKIWNFTWDSAWRDCIGLFGYVGSAGQIKNLCLEDVNVYSMGGAEISGLVGQNGGTITNCYSTGSVSGVGWSVGGLVGENWGTIADCYTSANVSGAARVGGLVGCNHDTISDCYSSASVSGASKVGGLVGWNGLGGITSCYCTGRVLGTSSHVGSLVGLNDGTISSCYSSGSVSGVSFVGGLVGFARSGKVDNCYSIGTVDCNDHFGGLIGDVNAAVVEDCFWDVNTSGEPNSASGTPKTTAEMKTKSTFTDAGWDFVEIWGIGENQTYPFLRTEPTGDLNHDKKVNLADLAILASHWLEEK
jgi:hypothetical protein